MAFDDFMRTYLRNVESKRYWCERTRESLGRHITPPRHNLRKVYPYLDVHGNPWMSMDICLWIYMHTKSYLWKLGLPSRQEAAHGVMATISN